MSTIQWTKTYGVHVGNKIFRIFITQQAEEFYGTFLYYTFTGNRALKTANELGKVTFHKETFFANSED